MYSYDLLAPPLSSVFFNNVSASLYSNRTHQSFDNAIQQVFIKYTTVLHGKEWITASKNEKIKDARIYESLAGLRVHTSGANI